MGICRLSAVAAIVTMLVSPSILCAGEHGRAADGTFFSMTSITILAVYCGLIALSSLGGGVLPTLIRLTHVRMQLLVSLIGGLMLGVGIFHQLPHAVAIMPAQTEGGTSALDWCMWWLMIGLLLTFFMLRMFHFHSHEPLEEDGVHTHDCAHDHDHGHSHDHGHGHDSHSPKKASWIGIFLGLSLHTLLDGVALAAAVQADALHFHEHSGFALPFGFGTFLGVVLHKPLDSLSIASLMATGGWTRRAMQIVNVGYSLMCPIGAALFCIGIQRYSGVRGDVVAGALAMSAGVFLCISLSDLLPEVQFHSHDRLRLSLALLVGVGSAWLIGYFEPKHSHGPTTNPAIQEMQPEHQH
ncbi:ZIP family metal transporter [Schlesneria paludicola]|uniref:ZIP family metal transporter n=1 Tax=Schlesneria paludicola TaxID=360056 RepID=UPI00029AF975|nr:ZIP family metal transporter [Schlesneria paludicola]